MPIIIAMPVTILVFAIWFGYQIFREWRMFRNEPPKEVNEAERPALVKPHRRMYKGKGL